MEPFLLDQSVATKEHKKLQNALKLYSTAKHALAYQWADFTEIAGIDFASLTNGQELGKGGEHRATYLLLSPKGTEWTADLSSDEKLELGSHEDEDSEHASTPKTNVSKRKRDEDGVTMKPYCLYQGVLE